MKENIDVMIACGRNSELFVEFLIETIEKTASNLSNFRFLLGINDEFVNKTALQGIKTKYNIEIFDCITSGQSSYGHGEALDILFGFVKTDLCLVIDCDTAFLHKNWDMLFIDKLKSDDNIAIIGNEYENNSRKYRKFPNLVTSLFKTKIFRDCKISWKPADPKLRNNVVIDDINSEIFSMNPGEIIDLDTGWEICSKLKMNGFSGVSLPLHRKTSNDDCLFLKEGIRGEEHWLDGIVICTHVGRSFTRPLTSDAGMAWKRNVEEWIDGQV